MEGNKKRISKRLLRRHESLFLVCQVFANIFFVSIVLIALLYFFDEKLSNAYKLVIVLVNIFVYMIYRLIGVYTQVESFAVMLARLSIGWLLVILMLLFTAFVMGVLKELSDQVLWCWFLIVLFIQIPMFKLNDFLVNGYRKKQIKPINCAVVGLGETARFLAKSIDNNKWLPDTVIGMINAYDIEPSREIKHSLQFPLLDNIANVKTIIERHSIKRLYIALPLKHSSKVEKLNELLSVFQVDVIWILDVSNWLLVNHSVKEVSGFPLLSLNMCPENELRVQIRIKHFLDKILALCLIIVLSPVFILAAIAVKLSSPGEVFYSQKRHGFNGEEITITKFRSMVVHDDSKVEQAKRGDQRVTKIGAILRSTSIDELPQLFNVLKGDMSLVGPRPHALKHNVFYTQAIDRYMLRHRIKPGITGLAQISGCRGETDTIEKMQRRVDFDMEYINHWSLWLDLKILIQTPLSLFSKNIY